MGMFSSKSKSSSTTQNTTNYNDSSTTVSGTIGDLSRNNVITGGNAILNGYSAEDTNSLLSTVISAVNDTTDKLKETTGQALQQVSSAYSGANQSILESTNETKALLNSLRPYALYAAIAAIVYFIFGKKGRR